MLPISCNNILMVACFYFFNLIVFSYFFFELMLIVQISLKNFLVLALYAYKSLMKTIIFKLVNLDEMLINMKL